MCVEKVGLKCRRLSLAKNCRVWGINQSLGPRYHVVRILYITRARGGRQQRYLQRDGDHQATSIPTMLHGDLRFEDSLFSRTWQRPKKRYDVGLPERNCPTVFLEEIERPAQEEQDSAGLPGGHIGQPCACRMLPELKPSLITRVS